MERSVSRNYLSSSVIFSVFSSFLSFPFRVQFFSPEIPPTIKKPPGIFSNLLIILAHAISNQAFFSNSTVNGIANLSDFEISSS
jgi:hypothetical protein